MGQRASNTAGVTFEDVVIPNEVYVCTCVLGLNELLCNKYIKLTKMIIG